MFQKASQLGILRTVVILSVATFAFTQWGYIWYATVFDDVWQSLIGRTEQDLVALAVSRGPIQSFFTYFISFVQAVGLFVLINIARAKTFWDYQFIAAVVALMIAVPVLGNAVLFAGTSIALWGLDIAHFILGYAGIALVFFIGRYTGLHEAAPRRGVVTEGHHEI